MSPIIKDCSLGFHRWDGHKWKPGFRTYYKLGVQLSKQMPTVHTYVQIGKLFGISKQNAYTEAVVALGKLAYLARKKFERKFYERCNDRNAQTGS